MPTKLTTEQFITKAKSVWGGTYDYSSAEYQGTDVPVKIICPKHGVFNMTPHHHISDHRGCAKCHHVTDIEVFIAGETLTDQELLNATYAGTWLSDAKNYFSKRNCVAGQMASGFIKGNPIRQDYLEKALSWIADKYHLDSGKKYMAIHQHDLDANELWLYFQEVISLAKRLFPKLDKKLTESQDWVVLYNKYKDKPYNSNELRSMIDKLLMDEDVTKQSGIIPYVLSDRRKYDEKYLSLRVFSEQMKRRVWEKQNHKCPICMKQDIDTEYEFSEMQGDHIIPWSKGGRTVEENCQMLCSRCNREKSNY